MDAKSTAKDPARAAAERIYRTFWPPRTPLDDDKVGRIAAVIKTTYAPLLAEMTAEVERLRKACEAARSSELQRRTSERNFELYDLLADSLADRQPGERA